MTPNDDWIMAIPDEELLKLLGPDWSRMTDRQKYLYQFAGMVDPDKKKAPAK